MAQGAQAGAEDGEEEAERLNHRPSMSDRNAGRNSAPTFAPNNAWILRREEIPERASPAWPGRRRLYYLALFDARTAARLHRAPEKPGADAPAVPTEE